jgi:hypothetical protein
MITQKWEKRQHTKWHDTLTRATVIACIRSNRLAKLCCHGLLRASCTLQYQVLAPLDPTAHKEHSAHGISLHQE